MLQAQMASRSNSGSPGRGCALGALGLHSSSLLDLLCSTQESGEYWSMVLGIKLFNCRRERFSG